MRGSTWFLFVIVYLLAGSICFAIPVKSFKEWKSEKIQTAQTQLGITKNSLQSLRQRLTAPEMSKNIALKALESQATQEQWNLEIAQELSVTDYLVLYLGSQKDSAKYINAANRLSTQETAEVLEAYVKTIDGKDIDAPKRLPIQAQEEK